MTNDAPERIWASSDEVEYVRADLYDALRRRADLRSELSETKKEVTDMETRALAAEAERDSYRTTANEMAARAAKAEAILALIPNALKD